MSERDDDITQAGADGATFYGNRSIYATCEICDSTGYLNDDGSQPSETGHTPLWSQHSPGKLECDRKKYGRF